MKEIRKEFFGCFNDFTANNIISELELDWRW